MSTIQTQTTAPEAPVAAPRGGIFKSWWWAPILLAVAGIGVAYTQMNATGAPKEELEVPLFKVASGPLTISVTETGQVRSTQVEILKCNVEGSTTVISIVEEGIFVNEGDLLIELDSSRYEDDKIDGEISVQNAKASLIQATERVEIEKQEALSVVQAAEVTLKLAQLDLEKYKADGGEYEQEIQQAEAKVTTSENDLTTAIDRLQWSKKLAADGFITAQDLNKDELDEEEKSLALRTAKNELELLKQYTRERETEKLSSDLKQAEFALEKEKHRTQSSIVDAEADLFAKEAMFKREEEKLEKIERQIAGCMITAPVDGMVVYATSVQGGMGRGRVQTEPLGEGSTVRERQELIRLPATEGGMTVDVKIHEAVLDKVTEGLPVRITTEALPGKVFDGRVERIAVMPDATSAFLNPDLKVYQSEITITSDTEGLRPGMSCNTEILVDHFDKTVFVPVQAVLRIGKNQVAYVWDMSKSEGVERIVETGLDNNRMMQIKNGLKDGEDVMMAPPLPDSVQQDTGFGKANKADAGKARQGGGEGGQAPQRPEGKTGGPGGKGGGKGGPGGARPQGGGDGPRGGGE